MRRVAIVVLSIIIVAVLFVVLCTFVVRPYETVILDRFGRVVPKEEQAHLMYGWYLCWPTDKVVRLDTRLHLYQSDLVQKNTASSEPIMVRAFAAWQIADPKRFYERFRGSDETAAATLDGKMMGHVGAVLGEHPLDDLFGSGTRIAPATQNAQDPAQEAMAVTKTEEMEAKITHDVNAEMMTLGMQVKQIGFSQMAFPPTVASSVYMRMTAERNAQAVAFRSAGAQQAETIRAHAKEAADTARADADRQAQAIRGAGDAKALEILAKSQDSQDAKNFYQFWRELELLKTSIGKETYLILRSDVPLMSQMFSRMQATPPSGVTR